MASGFRRWWPLVKAVVMLAVVVAVGWYLLRLLQSEELGRSDTARSSGEILWEETTSAQPAGLVLSGVLYLVGLAFPTAFWIWLVRSGGDALPLLPGVRAYYISHLGKYVPGKGLALAMRTALSAEAGCRPAAVLLTAVYETLTTMAAGALVAAGLLLAQGGDEGMMWKALALMVLAGLPILPGVFNWFVERIAQRFRRVGLTNLPRPGSRDLLGGVALLALSWFVLGASLEALLGAMQGSYIPDLHGWLRSTTFVAVSYVAGFVASTPGGLGVREVLLAEMLRPQLGGQAVVAAILLRVLWTVAEVVIAGVLWWFPARREPAPAQSAGGA